MTAAIASVETTTAFKILNDHRDALDRLAYARFSNEYKDTIDNEPDKKHVENILKSQLGKYQNRTFPPIFPIQRYSPLHKTKPAEAFERP